MSDFENNKILNHLKELQDQLESVNQKFKQLELELRSSGQSLERLYLSHKNSLDLVDQKRINENLSQQLASMQHEFANVQSGMVWYGMQMAVFLATLERAAFFVTSEREALKNQKRKEKELTDQVKFRHVREKTEADRHTREELEEKKRIEEMATKARVYPFHLTPFRTWPY